MFRPPASEFRRPRKRSFRPAVEDMEQRIVLDAATATVTVAAVTPTSAQRRILSTAAATAKAFAAVQARLVTLAGQMAKFPAGDARQPIVRKATSLVNGFLKQENARYKKFQAFVRIAPRTAGVANAASIERKVHQKANLIKRQVAWFGWASYTTFTLQPRARIAAVPDPGERQPKAQVRAQSKPMTQTEADLTLLYLEIILANLESKVSSYRPSNPIQARQMQENVGVISNLTVTLVFIQRILTERASQEAVDSFHEQLVQTVEAIDAADERAEEVIERCSTSTSVPAEAVHRGVKATPPPTLPIRDFPGLP